MSDDTQIQKLLRLKRYELPPEGYTESFLADFHRRQRGEILRRPLAEIVWDRLLAIAPNFHVPHAAYAAIVALAVCASAVILTSNDSPETVATSTPPQTLSLLTSNPVTIGTPQLVSTRADGNIPSHYVQQSRPARYEQPLSF
jgi:hypothetical protein